MATFTWYGYMGAGPGWTNISTNTIVFCGSATDLTVPITVGTWNSGTHVGNGDPGTDQCGANHMKNVKYVSTTNNTQFDNTGTTETINETNIAQTECTLQITFTDASSVATSAARFYAFNGSSETVEAVGVEAYALERVTGVTQWTMINDDSGDIGGDNTGERLTLADQATATEHTYYICVSARPETVGAKTQFDLGIALTYS
jgi:hypothetical protein